MVEKESRWQWNNIFKILKEKNCQSRILYPAKLSFKVQSEMKTFQKQGLRKLLPDIFSTRNNKDNPSG